MTFKDKLWVCLGIILSIMWVGYTLGVSNPPKDRQSVWEKHVEKGLSARIEKECKDYLKMKEYGIQYTHSFEYNFGAASVPKIENYCMSKYGSGIWI